MAGETPACMCMLPMLLRGLVIACFETEMRSWRGAEPLWKVFWMYGVLISWVHSLLCTHHLRRSDRATAGFARLLRYLYDVASVWRCADNTGESFWGLFARRAGNTVMLLIFLELGLVKTYLGY